MRFGPCLLALALAASAAAQQAASPDPGGAEESAFISRLYTLLNEARVEQKLPPLAMDSGLSAAAQKHAEAMAEHKELGHDFAGEPDLVARLSAAGARFSSAAENVADSDSAEDTQFEWMHSPGHRANILNPDYNAVGFGVVQVADNRFFITQDFAHRVPLYSPAELEDKVFEQLNRLRTQRRLPPLQHTQVNTLRDQACRSDVNAHGVGTAFASVGWVVVITASDPADMPDEISKVALNPDAHSLALGACYPASDRGSFAMFRMLALFFRKQGD